MADAARSAARQVEASPLVRALARGGYAASGAVHVLIGLLVLTLAFGVSGEADQSGALRAIAGAPLGLAVLWIIFIIAALSNGVNLSDGLDGLATGLTTMVFAAYAVVNLWQSSQSCASLSSAGPQSYEVRDPIDLAAISLALAASCFGFLWWNASPAKIFMGDTGSLAIGGGLAALSVFTRTELLMLIVAGLFLIITLSVVLQVGYFKATKGKRLFKMAPLQHHFELLGWAEITIVIRFWIICGLCVALGLGAFYAEWTVGLP